MGKAFEDEVRQIEPTVNWAKEINISNVQTSLFCAVQDSLICVASGGSLAAAALLASLHEERTGQISRAMTPLEFLTKPRLRRSSVFMLSASGANKDILNAFDHASALGYRNVFTMCGRSGSPLSLKAEQNYGSKHLLRMDSPAGGDGFLATNSLLGFLIVSLRLYGHSIQDLTLTPSCEPILLDPSLKTLVVLHSPDLGPAAIDLESRFVEAALGNIQISDFRNFAHGRHHWFAKQATGTAVLAMSTTPCRAIMDDTLRHIPEGLGVVRWNFESDCGLANLEAVLKSIHIAGARAQTLGWDSGKPGVPEFGERIYELAYQLPRATPPALAPEKLDSLTAEAGKASMAHFVEKLTSTRFRAIVLDFDGTIVDTNKRFDPVDPKISKELNRLLDEGMILGIATGRGISVCESLREAVSPKYWHQVYIGYYNGGQLNRLDTDLGEIPHTIHEDSHLKAAHVALKASKHLKRHNIECRPTQITICQSANCSPYFLWQMVQKKLINSNVDGVKAVVSSHSVDILPLKVSKTNLVQHLAEQYECQDAEILKIGDSGQWPGNDWELMMMPHALSVDEMSSELDSGWNLSNVRLTGAKMTLKYLQALHGGRFSWAIQDRQ